MTMLVIGKPLKTHDQHKLSKNMQNCLKIWDSTINWVYREHFWGKIETLYLSWELDLEGTLRKENCPKICSFAHIPYFKINPPIFCCPLFSENYLNPQVRISPEPFLKSVYSTMVAEKFQISSVKITANTFVSQKIEFAHFYSCTTPAKLSPRLLWLSSR